MIEVLTDNKKYSLKNKWEDFSQNDMKKVCFIRSMYFGEQNEISLNASRITLFKALSNVPLNKVRNIHDDQWYDILPHLNFIFDVPMITKNFFPKIRFGAFKTYYGPSGMLDHSSFGEMIQADTYFSKAGSDQDREFMYKLFSVLYRPIRRDLSEFKRSENWNGDIREPFNNFRCKQEIDSIKRKIPIEMITYCYLYYWSFRKNVMAQHKILFKKSESNVQRQGNDYGWAGTLMDLSDTIFGNIKETEQIHWREGIVFMQREVEKERDRKLKAAANKK